MVHYTDRQANATQDDPLAVDLARLAKLADARHMKPLEVTKSVRLLTGTTSSLSVPPTLEDYAALQARREQGQAEAAESAERLRARRAQEAEERAARRRRPPSPTAVRYEFGTRAPVEDSVGDDQDRDPERWDLVQELGTSAPTRPTYRRSWVEYDAPADWETEAGLEPYWYEIESADRLRTELEASRERETLAQWRALLCERCNERPKVRSLPWCDDCCCQNPNHTDDDLKAGKARCKRSGPAEGLLLCTACHEWARTHKGDLRPVRLLSGRKTPL